MSVEAWLTVSQSLSLHHDLTVFLFRDSLTNSEERDLQNYHNLTSGDATAKDLSGFYMMLRRPVKDDGQDKIHFLTPKDKRFEVDTPARPKFVAQKLIPAIKNGSEKIAFAKVLYQTIFGAPFPTQ